MNYANKKTSTIFLTVLIIAFLCGCGAKTAVPAPDVKGIELQGRNDKTTAVFNYIRDNFGKHMLAAQQESTWMGSVDYEMDYLMDVTGKLPAIRGLDFMNDDFDGVAERAVEWDKKGGIVTICWHTGVDISGYEESKKDKPDFDRLFTPGTDEYNTLMNSWDKAAKTLQRLRDENVPVLWRPFHEFDGKWFWWGKGGADNFVRLWRMMYDKFTDEYELDNLIWVLGYSEKMRDGWYPGDEYVDIVGSDNYDKKTTNLKAWNKLTEITNKPMAFHECSILPAVERFEEDGTIWAWFMIWHTEWLTDNKTETLKEVFNSDLVITLDELPEF
ncbi:MAG: glycoside hydrolase family 26 protein [Lachnospiraceae bacterium]|nr:glycoside hydrolase family 26 protein [Lachnospiraceae bacterium]